MTTTMHPDPVLASLCQQHGELIRAVEQEATTTVQAWQPWITRPAFSASAHNLAAYLSLRRRNLGDLQEALRRYGVGTLSFTERHVLPSLHLSQQALEALVGQTPDHVAGEQARAEMEQVRQQLKHNAAELFGKRPADSLAIPDIMVTLPSEAATDPTLISQLLAAGMTIARINTAHDDAVAWAQMLEHLRAAEQEQHKRCRVHIDLAGPKVRTQNVRLPQIPKHKAAKHHKDKDGKTKDPQRLYINDTLLAAHNSESAYAANDHLICVSCTLPEVSQMIAQGQIKEGEQVWFDDGKIGTVVQQVTPHGLLLRVTHARSKGENLKDEKGINFPDSTLKLPALTDKDVQDLAFAVSHADTVGYSFVQTVDDVERLLGQMERLGAKPELGIILKIETREAVNNIAPLMVRTAGARPCGVMIARGDLAVELGFGRQAEIQEELLQLCAAAHVPVVWATQVLESLVKKGTPSRGEFTDAAMSIRAEAVMLNKGPYVVQGVKELQSLLIRMHTHQHKDSLQFRALGIAALSKEVMTAQTVN